jgi:hypothetical protein
MYNSLYYIFTKDYAEDYSNSTLYMKDKLNKQKILSDSKERELRYVKKKYEDLCRRYNSLEWKYNELLLNTHHNRDYYNTLHTKYNLLKKKHNEGCVILDTQGDILSINDDYEHL